MMRAVARLGIDNPVAANLALIAIAVCGIAVYAGMPREVFPDLSLDQVEIMSLYPGAGPEDVERLVTAPLEEAVEGLAGLDEMVSSSREGVSRILLTLEDGRDVSDFAQEVRSAVSRGDVELPEDVDDPWVREVENVFPVISVYVYGWASEAQLRALAEHHARQLEALDGVSQVILTGSREPRMWIEVDPVALERYGLTLAEIGRAVESRARDVPLGSLSTEDGDWLLRVDARLEWAADLADLAVVARPDGSAVRLSDVARVSDTFERRLTRSRYDGRPCYHMQVDKKVAADMIDVARDVYAYVDREQPAMPPGTALGTNTDLSVYVQSRLDVMKQTGSVGAALLLVALLLFLDLRVALMTALGIPISFLGGILLAGALGVSMNMITMFALIVVLGMVVDDAIVVGENVFRLMEEGLSPREAALEGTAQVGKPVLATILTSVVAFLPVLLLEGTVGLFMRPLPLVVSFCLVVSLIEALAILPSHLAHFAPRRARAAASAGRTGAGAPRARWYDPARRAYLRLLELAVRWRYVTLTVAVGSASVFAGLALHWIPFVFFDDFESKLYYVNLRMEPGTSLDETERLTLPVEEAALGMPRAEIESVNTLVGVSATDTSTYEMAQNLSQVWIELGEGEARTRSSREIIDDLRSRLTNLPPQVASIEIDQPQSGPSGRAIEISIRGPDLAVLERLSRELQETLRGYAGTRDVYDNLERGKREVQIRLREAGRSLGFTEGGLAAQLRTAFEGTTYGHVRRGRDDVELVVKLPEWVREDPAALGRLRVSTPAGERVPLFAVAEAEEGVGPAVITHDDRERSVTVIADVNKEEGNAARILRDIGARNADFAVRHPGYRMEFEGDYEETVQALEGLTRAALIALALIYLILGTLFRSFAQPLIIMFIIPFAAVGMVGGHLLMDRSITLMSLIGLLALTGVVVNDSLILVDFINRERERGAALGRAILEAGRVRFRPIVLTSITTMLGLAPLTFFVTGQARFLQPMAVSLFFGLGAATVLVLVLVPCVYAVLEDLLALAKGPRRVARLLVRGDPIHT